MQIAKLYVQNLRKFTQATWEFGAGVNVMIAPNGWGKTTVLEAAHFLATTKSFRASKTKEMIRLGQEVAQIWVMTDEGVRLGATLTGGVVGGRRVGVKSLTVGRTRKRQQDFVGELLTVCFRPEDLLLVEGAASRRRDYIDEPLAMTNLAYRVARKNYQATVIRRNKTLQAIKNKELGEDALVYWDQQLCEYGKAVSAGRQQYVDWLNQAEPTELQLRVVYEQSLATQQRLAEYAAAERATGYSLVGPHKDDLVLYFNCAGQSEPLRIYGSRGQQRLAVLWLKLWQLRWLEQQTGRQPVLLLDDIFSELDQAAMAQVLALINRQQTLITTTEENVVELCGSKARIIKMERIDE